MVLNSFCGIATVCPSKYINLVMAASVVMSFPEITPKDYKAVLVSYCPILTLPPEHCVTFTICIPF